MFRDNWARVVICCVLIIASPGLTGCFTSVAPFYEEGQIIQDARIEGTHESYSSMTGEDNKDESVWWIAASSDKKGKYDVNPHRRSRACVGHIVIKNQMCLAS